MKNLTIRTLEAADIDVRIAQTSSGKDGVKVSLLLYKDARVDMKILDELFTPMGWRRSHHLIGDRLYCQVDVWDDEKNEWVSKEDVGVESNTEAEKGQASDSFKRACFNWGIGRELYTAPRINVTLKDGEYSNEGGRIKVWATFSVKSIAYNESREIVSLAIVDKYGNLRYSLGDQITTEQPAPVPQKRTRKKAQPEYKPLDHATYWKIVKAYAEGRPTKSGGDYKQTWIEMTNAPQDIISGFDQDVENYRRGTVSALNFQ